MKAMHAATVFAAFLPLAACATGPKPVPAPSLAAGQPSARVTVTKGYKSGFGVSGGTEYSVFDSGDCEHRRANWRMLWTTGGSKSTPVATGRVVLTAQTTYYFTASVSMINGAAVANVDSWGCYGSASFVAAPGHTYEASHRSTLYSRCHMEVKDTGTGKAPEGLSVRPDVGCLDYLAADAASAEEKNQRR